MKTIIHVNKNGSIQKKAIIESINDLKDLNINLSTSNIKLNKEGSASQIASFSLLGSATQKLLFIDGFDVFKLGITSLCNNCGDCINYCYNKKNYWRTNVVNSRIKHLLLSQQAYFKDLLRIALTKYLQECEKKNTEAVVRLHVEGDFYNAKYLLDWLDVMQEFDQIKFYTYTKAYSLILDHYHEIKSVPNLNIMVSSVPNQEQQVRDKIHVLRGLGFQIYHITTKNPKEVIDTNKSFIGCDGACVECRNCIDGFKDVVVSIH